MSWPLPMFVKRLPFPVQVRFQDLRFRFWAPYRIAKQARTRGIENRICRLARSVGGPRTVAVDVGANYGFVTLIAALSGALVESFEIDPRVAKVLQRNLRANTVAERVSVHPFGAGMPPLIRLDDVLNLDRFDFFKVDTDGSDLDVLLGAHDLLTRFHPVVVVEMTANQQAIYDFLTGLGYDCLTGMDNETVQPGDWPANLIAATREVRIPPR